MRARDAPERCAPLQTRSLLDLYIRWRLHRCRDGEPLVADRRGSQPFGQHDLRRCDPRPEEPGCQRLEPSRVVGDEAGFDTEHDQRCRQCDGREAQAPDVRWFAEGVAGWDRFWFTPRKPHVLALLRADGSVLYQTPGVPEARLAGLLAGFKASPAGNMERLEAAGFIQRYEARLDALKLAESTIVLFTSDHGYNIGQHGIYTKGNASWILAGTRGPKRPNMYEESIRMPFLVRWPAGIKPGTRIRSEIPWIACRSTSSAVATPREVSWLSWIAKVPWPTRTRQRPSGTTTMLSAMRAVLLSTLGGRQRPVGL